MYMRIKLSIPENNASHLCITEPKENFATLTDNFETKESLKISPTTKIFINMRSYRKHWNCESLISVKYYEKLYAQKPFWRIDFIYMKIVCGSYRFSSNNCINNSFWSFKAFFFFTITWYSCQKIKSKFLKVISIINSNVSCALVSIDFKLSFCYVLCIKSNNTGVKFYFCLFILKLQYLSPSVLITAQRWYFFVCVCVWLVEG